MSRTAEDALVAAFYARVVQRVCSDFCESDPDANTAVAALLAEKWRERIECYTGVPIAPDASASVSADHPTSERADEDAVDAGDRRRQPLSTVNHIAALSAEGRRPQSVFAAMLTKKRRISQLDGAHAPSDDDNDDDYNDEDAEEEEDENAEEDEDDSDDIARTRHPAPSSVLTTPSREVAAVLAPVWGVSVSAFPMQLAAEHTKFEYRRRRRDFYGKLSAIVLTLTRSLRPNELVRAGHLLWLSDARTFPAAESNSGTVEVLQASSDGSDAAVVVKLPDGASATVARPQLARFYECIVKKGVVWVKVQR